MNDIALSVRNLTKVYRLYEKPVDRLKESLNPFVKKYHRDFFALNDVSFDVKVGETIGIIGKNGAGKSTLLKIITGVLTPSKGYVLTHGNKIASLLELGAGFNPEYTGLENIYFQGMLMGYSQTEMEAKVEEILAFADIGDYIHQPVKSYSSGMFARLAFSVAINVDPDILIVDEVLSVGDMAFQNKCIRRMEEFRKRGKTVLFVSHDVQAIKKFCQRVIWIHNGSLRDQGAPSTVTEDYMSLMTYGMETIRIMKDASAEMDGQVSKEVMEELVDVKDLDSFGKKDALIEKIGFFDEFGPTIKLQQGKIITFVCEFTSSVVLRDVAVGVLFKDALNTEILTFNSYMYNSPIEQVLPNQTVRTSIRFKVPKIYPRDYLVTVALSEGTTTNHIQQHWIHSALTVSVISCDFIDSFIVSLYPEDIEFKYQLVNQKQAKNQDF